MKASFTQYAARLAFSLAVVAALMLGGGHVSAAGQTQHYGPYASVSPDSGTCGNDWATDMFNRDFRVNSAQNSDGTYTITEDFKQGHFVTNAGPSPGGCETNLGGTLLAGVTGSMHGSFTITVTGGTYNPDGQCGAGDCTTASFIAAHFGPGATYNVPSYEFHYSAGNNGEWKNASADRGGDHGDITGAP